MLANQIGYFSLILGLLISFFLCIVSIKNFYDKNENISQNILSLTFLQFFFVVVSFLGFVVWELLKTVSLLKSELTNEKTNPKKLTTTKKNCKKVSDKMF